MFHLCVRVPLLSPPDVLIFVLRPAHGPSLPSPPPPLFFGFFDLDPRRLPLLSLLNVLFFIFVLFFVFVRPFFTDRVRVP